MEKYKIKSLYTDMIKNIKKRPYQVLKGTKTLALSSPKYHSFYKNSMDTLQTKTFKLPNETEYPKLVKSEYISLQKKINTFSFNSKTISTKPLFKPKSAKPYLKTSFVEQFKKKKNINFFVGEKYLKRNYFFPNQKYSYTQIPKRNNDEYNFYSSPFYSIKNTEKRVKDFFMLLNSIFYDDDYYYNDLKYNENEIYGQKEEYLKYLKDELNYFLKKEKEFDVKSDLLQVFPTKKYGKIELYLKSARFEVIDESSKEKDSKLISINLPFHFMCLIFLCSGEQINYLIIIILKKCGIVNINDIKENMINLSDEDKKRIFLEILGLIKFKNDNITFNLEQKNHEKFHSQLQFLEKIKDITDQTKYNNFLTIFLNDNNKIKIIDNSNNKIYNTPNYKSNNKINFETNLNKYTLYIISLNKQYTVHFYLPEILLIFNNYYKQINHFIDKELFLHLYQNNFMCWDYYVLHFLFSYKNFRQFMCSILSIQTKNIQNLKTNNNYFRSKTKLQKKKISNIIEENSNKKYYLSPDKSDVLRTFTEHQLNEIYSYETKLNESCHEFSFLFSSNTNVYLYKLKSYSLYIFFTNINKPIIYEFNFNFHQMKILYFISLFENLRTFMKKLLYIKDDVIYLDYCYFESFSNMSNQEIFKYFSDIHNMNEKTKLNNLQSQSQNILNSLTLRICEPFIEINDFDIDNEKKIIQSHIKLKNDFLNDIINIKINNEEWMKKINEYRNEFDIKNQVKYEDNKNQKVKKQMNMSSKSKDLHKPLNKFLKIS